MRLPVILLLLLLLLISLQAHADRHRQALGPTQKLVSAKISQSASAKTVRRWVEDRRGPTVTARTVIRKVIRAEKDAMRLIALGTQSKLRAQGFAEAIKQDTERFELMRVGVKALSNQIQDATALGNAAPLNPSLKKRIRRIGKKEEKTADIVRGFDEAVLLVGLTEDPTQVKRGPEKGLRLEWRTLAGTTPFEFPTRNSERIAVTKALGVLEKNMGKGNLYDSLRTLDQLHNTDSRLWARYGPTSREHNRIAAAAGKLLAAIRKLDLAGVTQQLLPTIDGKRSRSTRGYFIFIEQNVASDIRQEWVKQGARQVKNLISEIKQKLPFLQKSSTEVHRQLAVVQRAIAFTEALGEVGGGTMAFFLGLGKGTGTGLTADLQKLQATLEAKTR